MSSLIIIIIALTVNLLPANVKEFSVELSPKDTLQFTKQSDGGWEGIKLSNKKSIGIFHLDGLMLTALANGKENKIDTSKFLGVKTKEQIKDLTQIEMGEKLIKIEKKDSGILLKMDDSTIKISWEKK